MSRAGRQHRKVERTDGRQRLQGGEFTNYSPDFFGMQTIDIEKKKKSVYNGCIDHEGREGLWIMIFVWVM